MLQKLRPISRLRFRIAGLLAGLLLTSCASTWVSQKASGPRTAEAVFYAEPEVVERAVKRAMFRYPQRVENLEAGIFETDFVRGEMRFRSPVQTKDYSAGYRYRILIRIAKGRTKGRSAVKVLVTKKIELLRDFFADGEEKESDGLEEKVILYRIRRELLLEKARQRAQERVNKMQSPSSPQ